MVGHPCFGVCYFRVVATSPERGSAKIRGSNQSSRGLRWRDGQWCEGTVGADGKHRPWRAVRSPHREHPQNDFGIISGLFAPVPALWRRSVLMSWSPPERSKL